MASFNASIDLIFKAEGGFSNHKNDAGGATKFGITQLTLNVYNKFIQEEEVTLHVKDLQPFEARQIYEQMYWKPLKLDEIEDQKLAHCIFDQAINQGAQIAVKRMQQVFNFNCRVLQPLKIDGIIGPRTILAFNSAQNKTKICLDFIKLSQHYYIEIVKVKNDQMVFLTGWINRTQNLLDYIIFSRH
jgi:lysozyme family protein